MTTFDINIKKLNENATIPSYGSEFAAGADLYACMEEPVTIAAGETQFIHTGLAIEIPAEAEKLLAALKKELKQ